MTKLEVFKQTSDKPYIRHDYKVNFSNGNFVVFDNYEDVQLSWFQRAGRFLSHVEVLDIKEKKRGFK